MCVGESVVCIWRKRGERHCQSCEEGMCGGNAVEDSGVECRRGNEGERRLGLRLIPRVYEALPQGAITVGFLLAQRWDRMEGRRTVPNWGLEYSYFVS